MLAKPVSFRRRLAAVERERIIGRRESRRELNLGDLESTTWPESERG